METIKSSSKFTVLIEGLPAEDNQSEVEKFFENLLVKNNIKSGPQESENRQITDNKYKNEKILEKLDIRQVNFPINISSYIKLIREKKKIYKLYNACLNKNHEEAQLKDFRNKLTEIHLKEQKIQNEFISKEQSNHSTGIAFIIFNKFEHRNKFYKKWRMGTFRKGFLKIIFFLFKNKKSILNLFIGDSSLYKSKDFISVVRAPEPSDIIWENLGISNTVKFYRKSINMFIMFILTVACFFGIIAIKTFQLHRSKTVKESQLLLTFISFL